MLFHVQNLAPAVLNPSGITTVWRRWRPRGNTGVRHVVLSSTDVPVADIHPISADTTSLRCPIDHFYLSINCAPGQTSLHLCYFRKPSFFFFFFLAFDSVLILSEGIRQHGSLFMPVQVANGSGLSRTRRTPGNSSSTASVGPAIDGSQCRYANVRFLSNC
jgi:hypothetical protein